MRACFYNTQTIGAACIWACTLLNERHDCRSPHLVTQSMGKKQGKKSEKRMQNRIQGTGIGHYGLLDIKVENLLGYIHVINCDQVNFVEGRARKLCVLTWARQNGVSAKIPEGIQGTEIIKQKKYMQCLLGLLHWRGRPTGGQGDTPPFWPHDPFSLSRDCERKVSIRTDVIPSHARLCGVVGIEICRNFSLNV